MNRQHQDECEQATGERKPLGGKYPDSEWLGAAMHSIGDGVIATDNEGDVTFLNPVAESLTGWSADEAAGQPLDTVFRIVDEDTREPIENPAHRAIQGVAVGLVNHSILIAKDGTKRAIDDSAAPIRDGDGHVSGVVLVFRDVSQKREAERRRNARLAVTQILAMETSIEKAIPDVLAAICSALEWDIASFWRLSPEDNKLHCQECWMRPSRKLETFCEATTRLSFGPGDSLPGRAWQRGEPVWVPDVVTYSGFWRAPQSEEVGLHGGFACPVTAGTTFLGVIECFSREIKEPDEDLLEMMATISGQIGQFLERRNAEEKLRHSEEMLGDFFENATLALHWVGPEGTILRANQAELDLLGYSREEYIGRNIAEFHVDQAVIEEILRRLHAGEQVQNCEAQLRRKDGTVCDVLIDSSVLREGGRFIHSRCFTRDITERKRAENALRESEERFRLLADAAPVLIWMSGPEKEGVYFNQPWLTFTGKTLQEQQGDGWFELVHPDDQQPLSEACQEGHKNRSPFTAEFRLKRADGQYRWLLDTGTPRFDPDGRFAGFIGSCVDITERKQAEEAQAHLAAVVRSSDDAIITKTLDGTITSWNVAAQRIFGYTAAEAIGSPNTLIIPPELHKEERDLLERLKEGEQIAHFETVRVSKQGRRIDVSLTLSPIRDAANRIVGASKVARDITDRRRAAEALRESEERFRTLGENIPQLAWMTQPNGWIFWYNRRWFEYTGTALEEMQGWGWQKVHHPEHVDRVTETFQQAIHAGEPWEDTFPLRGKDGKYRWFLSRAFPIRDTSGKITRWFGTNTDITELLQTQAALRESERRLATLVSSLPGMAYRCLNDRNWTMEFVSDGAALLTGYTPDDFLSGGVLWSELIHPDDENLVWETVQQGVKDRRPYQIEYRIFHRDGLVRWVWEQGEGIFEEDAEPVALEGFLADITERKFAETALEAKEAELELITETTPLIFTRCSRDLRYRFVNRAAAALFGLSPDQMIGRPIIDIMGEKNFARIKPYIDRVLEGEAVEYEIELCYDVAGPRWVHVNYIPERNAGGELDGWIASIVDITDRKQAEEALRQSQERLEIALEASEAAPWGWNVPDNRVDEWNSPYRLLYGFSPEERPSIKRWLKQVLPQDRPGLNNRMKQIERTPGDDAWNEEFRINHPEKGVRWIAGIGRCTRDESGQILRMTGVNFDVTERKQREYALKFLAHASESLVTLVDYKTTLQQVAQLAVPEFADWCAVDMRDAAGFVQRVAVAHVDPAKIQLAEELSRRYPPDPDAPRGVMNVLRTGKPDYAESISDELLAESARDEEHLQILRELNPRSYICLPLKAKEATIGAMTFVSAESGRQYGPDDLALAKELARRAGIAIENARLYQEVQEAHRRKDEFLAMLAHELRNPLAPIRSGLDILAMEPGRDQEMIGIMQEQVEHVVRLVDDLLDVSRIMRGKIELRKRPVQLSSLIRQSVEAIRPLVAGHDLELKVSLPEGPVWLEADPVRLLQVIENLLTNSAKYTEPGGRIAISVEVEQREAVLAVQDTGVGIEPELLPTVFELFTQSSRSLDRAKGGLGIGLTLVRRLVEMHEGTVTAHSEGPGQGSTFTVRLPVTHRIPPAEAVAERMETSESWRIVVVDDNVGAAVLLAKLLEKMGSHEVVMAHDGPSALARIEESHPEVVLLDIGLPGMNGYQVASALRKNPEFDDVLLVALTGYGQKEDREKAKEAGFDEHQVKPPSLDQLKVILAHPKLNTRKQQSAGTIPVSGEARQAARRAAAKVQDPRHEKFQLSVSLAKELREIKHDLGNVGYVLSLIGEMFMNPKADAEAVTRAREAMQQEIKTINGLIQALQNLIDQREP